MGLGLESLKKHIGLHIGQYYQVNEKDNTCNINTTRTKGSICMGPSWNIQGGFMFMSLRSMENITRRSWDMILMSNTAIDWVNISVKYLLVDMLVDITPDVYGPYITTDSKGNK